MWNIFCSMNMNAEVTPKHKTSLMPMKPDKNTGHICSGQTLHFRNFLLTSVAKLALVFNIIPEVEFLLIRHSLNDETKGEEHSADDFTRTKIAAIVVYTSVDEDNWKTDGVDPHSLLGRRHERVLEGHDGGLGENNQKGRQGKEN